MTPTGGTGAAPLRFRDVQPAERPPFREFELSSQPLTTAVSRLSQDAGRPEWRAHENDETTPALGERSGMGMGRRGRQTMPSRRARGIDVDVAARQRRRRVSANFAGSVEGGLPRNPPGALRLGRSQVQRRDSLLRCRRFSSTRSLRLSRSVTSVESQKSRQWS